MPVFLQINLSRFPPISRVQSKLERFREPTNAMPDVPDADNEDVRDDEVKEKTITDPITYPNQTSSCATQSFVERKDDIDCEDGTDPHNVVAPSISLNPMNTSRVHPH